MVKDSLKIFYACDQEGGGKCEKTNNNSRRVLRINRCCPPTSLRNQKKMN
jgi:hypothetical protein